MAARRGRARARVCVYMCARGGRLDASAGPPPPSALPKSGPGPAFSGNQRRGAGIFGPMARRRAAAFAWIAAKAARRRAAARGGARAASRFFADRSWPRLGASRALRAWRADCCGPAPCPARAQCSRRRPAAPRRAPLRARLTADQAPPRKGAARRQARNPLGIALAACRTASGRLDPARAANLDPPSLLPSRRRLADRSTARGPAACGKPAALPARSLVPGRGRGRAAGKSAADCMLRRLSGICEQAARRSARSVRPRGCWPIQWAARPQAGASPGLAWDRMASPADFLNMGGRPHGGVGAARAGKRGAPLV